MRRQSMLVEVRQSVKGVVGGNGHPMLRPACLNANFPCDYRRTTKVRRMVTVLRIAKGVGVVNGQPMLRCSFAWLNTNYPCDLRTAKVRQIVKVHRNERVVGIRRWLGVRL
jgi:hypothetical protein